MLALLLAAATTVASKASSFGSPQPLVIVLVARAWFSRRMGSQ
jgi:hypothetical protein